MRILYVVSRPLEINTSASVRNHATISGLIQNGHQVTLVSASPDKNHEAYDPTLSVEGADKKYFNLGGMQTVAGVGRKFKFLNRIKPFIYKLLYGSQIYDNLKGLVNFVDKINLENFDLVISSSDPKSSHLVVDELFKKSKKQIPWIQIWGDPFADDITLQRKKKEAVAKEECRLLRLADKIVYVSDLTCNSQKKKYSEDSSKMNYIPIPYLIPRISGKQFPNEIKKIKLCYCGDYNSHIRNLKPLYDAVKEVGMSLQVCGMSDLELRSTDQISVLPRQTAEQVRKFEDEADILVHLSNKRGTQIPGKIYQYISTDRTILFILDGDCEHLKSLFEPYQRFIFAENKKDKIKEILNNISELREEVINEPLNSFSAKAISERIVALIDAGRDNCQ